MKIHKADKSTIDKAVRILKEGGLVAFPTETVYGLGGNAFNDSAIEKIYAAKGRPSNNPLIVHTYNLTKVLEYAAELNLQTKNRLEKLGVIWPGPLTVILPRSKSISTKIGTETNSIALRIPDHPIALELLKSADLPIAAPSANQSGYLSPTTAKHVSDGLHDKVDLIIDGGPCKIGIESTVLSLLEDVPVILRPGTITQEVIEFKLGEKIDIGMKGDVLVSPGLLAKHYAPKTPLTFLKDAKDIDTKGKKIGIIRFNNPTDLHNTKEIVEIILSSEPGDIACGLYSALHELDNQGLDLILIDHLPENGIGIAIMDRIKRAIHLK